MDFHDFACSKGFKMKYTLINSTSKATQCTNK